MVYDVHSRLLVGSAPAFLRGGGVAAAAAGTGGTRVWEQRRRRRLHRRALAAVCQVRAVGPVRVARLMERVHADVHLARGDVQPPAPWADRRAVHHLPGSGRPCLAVPGQPVVAEDARPQQQRPRRPDPAGARPPGQAAVAQPQRQLSGGRHTGSSDNVCSAHDAQPGC